MAEPGGGAEAITITGATATGKTELGVEVAARLGGVVISMDSRQVYRGLDIGTAKVRSEQMRGVHHFGLDLVEPGARYSAGRFGRDARGWIAESRARGQVPVLVGGTGFFLRSLSHPLFREPPLDPARRRALQRWLEERPATVLRRWLCALDPGAAERLSGRGGRQRILRALEIALLTGRTLDWWHARADGGAEPVPLLIFVLELPREELYRRIDERVQRMIEAGLVDEVRGLLEAGVEPRDPGFSATGYPEIVAHLRGELSLADAIDAIQRATRRYARRQITWFRHQLPAHAMRLDAMRPREELAYEIICRWREGGRV